MSCQEGLTRVRPLQGTTDHKIIIIDYRSWNHISRHPFSHALEKELEVFERCLKCWFSLMNCRRATNYYIPVWRSPLKFYLSVSCYIGKFVYCQTSWRVVALTKLFGWQRRIRLNSEWLFFFKYRFVETINENTIFNSLLIYKTSQNKVSF